MGKRRSFGSVRRVSGGRWQARYVDPLTGKRIAAPSTFATKGDATRWLARVEAGVVDGQAIAALRSDERLKAYAERWLAQRRLKPRTRELYEGQLRLHILPTLGEARLARLEPRHVRVWYADLQDGELSSVTVAKVYRLLRSILATAVEDKILASNSCQIRGGGVEQIRERPIPTVQDFQAVYERLPDHLAAVAALAAFAGLRKGEILGLQRRHINLERATVRIEHALQEVTGKGAILVDPKTAGSRRTVAIPAYLVEILADHLEAHVGHGREALLFTNGNNDPVRRSVWHPAWDSARRDAGLDQLRLHDLRHLAGTLNAQAGATLRETMAFLGHTSMTAAIRYQHVATDRNTEIAQRMDQLVRRDRKSGDKPG